MAGGPAPDIAAEATRPTVTSNIRHPHEVTARNPLTQLDRGEPHPPDHVQIALNTQRQLLAEQLDAQIVQPLTTLSLSLQTAALNDDGRLDNVEELIADTVELLRNARELADLLQGECHDRYQ